MSNISGINNSLANTYAQLSSGKRINSAADDAAGLAIAQEQNTQVAGYEKGIENVQSGQELINVADSGMSGITDYLQRIKELALSASNTALMGEEDLNAIQDEIDQLKEGINDIAKNTNYNGKTLLDGSNQAFNLATDANGITKSISSANSVVEALGIADFDVTTGNFDMETIDNAIESVSTMRSEMGAQSNALEYVKNYNSEAAYNHASASSKVEDLDYPTAVTQKKKEETLLQYQIMMQRRKQEDEENLKNQLFK
ncbi:MAG: flagellin FliC5 [Lachnospiraceae bacterium]|nr:flagellin FliC5 [Lachnospiraceae bacterium]